MAVSLSRRILNARSISLYVLSGTVIVTTVLVASAWLGLKLWEVGVFVLLAWCPCVLYLMSKLHRLYGWGMAFLFLLLITQTAHLIEHTAQVIELHILGLKGAQASGIIGQLNTEWVHLIWNSWVLVFCFFLVYWFRKNYWLWGLAIFAVYHEAEHLYIISVYLRTGIAGTPGFLGKGGLFWGGTPWIRPDVHFAYAVIEEALLLAIFISELRKASIKAAPASGSRLALAS